MQTRPIEVTAGNTVPLRSLCRFCSPYWMRITNGGIGMHYSGYVHRYPGSNGCIRMPKAPVRTIFAKTKVGTPVQVVQ